MTIWFVVLGWIALIFFCFAFIYGLLLLAFHYPAAFAIVVIAGAVFLPHD